MLTLNLASHHLAMLRDESSIIDDVIAERGYRSLDAMESYGALVALGFSKSQAKGGAGLLLPLHRTDGKPGITVYRPDHPRTNKDGRLQKYLIPTGATSQIDCPPRCFPLLIDPDRPLWVTEGQKKADSLASHGAVALALLGVWNFMGTNAKGTRTILEDFDYVGWDSRAVHIVFDNDVMSKLSVRTALDRLTAHIQRKGAVVKIVHLPMHDGVKLGVDDFFAQGHTLQDLEGLIEAPRVQVKAQPRPDGVELLPKSPPMLSRPLALIDGKGYAALWPWVKVTKHETLNSKGDVVRLVPPRVTQEQRLFLLRDDGVIFGEGEQHTFDDLGMVLRLKEIPPRESLWTTPGVFAYLGGTRPDPAAVFTQVAAVVDRFIDFNRSLGSQETMCELVACYVMASWFLDCFNVMGYLWPNGEKGSGKTQLLTVVAELGYLGRVVAGHGGSFASLRDLADYGATLAFDDAEDVMDVKRGDPDKRALLLAGNRKGNTIPVKEVGASGEWQTRHVSTFCSRLFSAIRLPDPVLASRTIIVPLIRTANREKANADPLEYALWPTPREELLDNLWALALHYRSSMPTYDGTIGAHTTTLLGRNLEPWRAIFAIAAWLTDKGVANLRQRMEALALTYQTERIDLEPSDLTPLTIRALCHHLISCATSATNSTSATSIVTWDDGEDKKIVTADIAAVAKTLAEDQEGGVKPETISTDRVGRVLGKMRLRSEPRPGGKGKRTWLLAKGDLRQWLASYGISIPDELKDVLSTLSPFNTSGTSGISGTSGTQPPAHTHGANGANGASPPAFETFTASVLWCARCQAAQPVQEAGTFLWCGVCGAMVGTTTLTTTPSADEKGVVI